MALITTSCTMLPTFIHNSSETLSMKFNPFNLFVTSTVEIEENNRMGKTRDLLKKIRDTKRTFHAKMGSIKDRNGMDLTEASLVAQMVKRLSTMWETWVRALGWEDPLEKEMAIHSSTIAWKIPWTEEPGRLQSMGLQTVGHEYSNDFTFIKYQIGEIL